MRTHFTERMHVQYTTNGTKVCTYKEHRMYCITYQQPNTSCSTGLAYHKRTEATNRLARLIAENGGIKHA